MYSKENRDTTNPDFPLVSIMIPTYNQAHCVHKAIESALAQDYPNLEVVIADDCSPDQTQEVVQKYLKDKRIKYFHNEINLGRVRNYKKLLEEYASGEWVVNCDGDDFYIDNHFISEAIEIITMYKDEKIVFLLGGKISEFTNRTVCYLPKIDGDVKFMSGKDYFLSFEKEMSLSHISTLYKRDIARSIDFYRYDIPSADRESFLRLALHGNVVIVKKAYGKWIGHNENFSQKTDLKTTKGNFKFIEESYKYALNFDFEKERLVKWKKNITVSYFRASIGKTILNNANFLSKMRKIFELLTYIVKHHPNLLVTKLMFTILFIPIRIIFTYLGIYKHAH